MDTTIDFVKVSPALDCLHFAFEKTLFSVNDISSGNVLVTVETVSSLPVIIFRFKDRSKNFLHTLNYYELQKGEQMWLAKDKLVLRLAVEGSDTAFTDYQLYKRQSDEIREALQRQALYSVQSINVIETLAHSTLSDMLG